MVQPAPRPLSKNWEWGQGLLSSMPVGTMPSRALRGKDASQLPPTQVSCLIYLSQNSSSLQLDRPTKQMREAEERLKAIPQFCFPDAKDWLPVSEYTR